ncbi:MAG: alpha/beta fold hydrolase [Patescibacteria group bacterium]
MALGIILVHGYSGSRQNLTPLAAELTAVFGQDAVIDLALPGHDGQRTPEFAEELFIGTIGRAIRFHIESKKRTVVVGHSTGGNLALAALDRFSLLPDLLILVSVPKKIDPACQDRWEAHRRGKERLSLSDLAMMIRLINTTGRKRWETSFPVLIVHGEEDELVLCQESRAWEADGFPGSARVVTIPRASHDVFHGAGSRFAIDVIRRSIADLADRDDYTREAVEALKAIEPGLPGFLQAAPYAGRHLSLAPGVQRVMGGKPALLPKVENDPAIANIEITTCCNLGCRFCARSRLRKRNEHMPLQRFRDILALLPNTYKIVLVGLGEPLLHPQLIELIQFAKAQKRKVGLVTNGMLLHAELSRRLLEAGLDAITFSIDGFDAESSKNVRQGTDFELVIRNIKGFLALSSDTRAVSTAVFSAVSVHTVSRLPDLIDRVAELGVDALMLTDLNFQVNLRHTLWQNRAAPLEEAVRNAVSRAFAKHLPVLSVRGLEEFGLDLRYHPFLLIPPEQLCERSQKHAWCLSPWQTIPVGVEGGITLCDCQPDSPVGNLLLQPFSEIWRGEAFNEHRAAMLGPDPPRACRICPRF